MSEGNIGYQIKTTVLGMGYLFWSCWSMEFNIYIKCIFIMCY